jgi:hypothetical protein
VHVLSLITGAALFAGWHGSLAATVGQAPPMCSQKIVVHDNGTMSSGSALFKSGEELRIFFVEFHKRHPNCALSFAVGKNIPFQALGMAIYAAEQAGYPKIGFLIEPPPAHSK